MSISRSITRTSGNLVPGETFPKSHRLRSKRHISELFETGNAVHTPLLTGVWKITVLPENVPAQVLFSVPKKAFRLAVTRNLVKRRLREAYRKSKKPLCEWLEKHNKQLVFAVIMKGDKVPDYAQAEQNIMDLLSRLITGFEKNGMLNKY